MSIKVEFQFVSPDRIFMLAPTREEEGAMVPTGARISKLGYVLDADGLVTTETGYIVRMGDGHCFIIKIKPVTFTRGELVISDDDSERDPSLCHGTIAIVGQKPAECINPTPCAEHGINVRAER